jgi:hypothetical protein
MYNDDLFFYDDPHTLFNYWPAEVWAHIDKHEPALGMSQRQVMMAVGQVQDPHGGTFANRSITFDNAGKPVTIEFQNDKAVKITPGE